MIFKMISDVVVEKNVPSKKRGQKRHGYWLATLIVVSVLAGYKPDGQRPRLEIVISAADQTGRQRSTPFSAVLSDSSIAERHHLIGHERIAARVVPMCECRPFAPWVSLIGPYVDGCRVLIGFIAYWPGNNQPSRYITPCRRPTFHHWRSRVSRSSESMALR